MSLTIAQLVNNATASTLSNGQNTTQSTTAASHVSKAMDKAGARIQTLLDTTTAQLSSFGKLKSDVSDVQLDAKTLGATTTQSSVADVRAAASRFATSFNAAVITANSTANLSSASALESSNARRVTRDLGNALSGNTAIADAAKKLGFKLESDGSLTVDAKKFDAAQKADPAAAQATLAKLAQAVEKSASKELAAGGVVNGSIASLNQRSSTLKTQQSAMQAAVKQLSASQTTSNSNTGYVGYGLSAYLK
ncbi:MAG: flagellar filament capping protein FliD [Rhodoferax sp.]|nr:flagellar filament capping protein FliD [Rhodoferax sp.]